MSIAITPPAANATAPVAELKLSPITYPNTAVSAQASTTAPHIKPFFAIDHPWLASSELGANAWGTFETQTAATNEPSIAMPGTNLLNRLDVLMTTSRYRNRDDAPAL